MSNTYNIYKINFEKWQSWDTERQIKALAEFKAFIAELEAGLMNNGAEIEARLMKKYC